MKRIKLYGVREFGQELPVYPGIDDEDDRIVLPAYNNDCR